MPWIEELRQDMASISSKTNDLSKFGYTIGGIVIAVCSLLWWLHTMSMEQALAGILIGTTLVILGLVTPASLRLIHFVWMMFATILGSIVSRVVLLVVFFIIVTPIAIVARIAKKKFFYSYKDNDKKTYWIRRDTTKKINYEQMF